MRIFHESGSVRPMRRPALLLYPLAFLLPILSLLLSSLMRVLFAKGDFALIFDELERELLPILRSLREADSLSGFFAAANPDVRCKALILSLSPLNLPMLLAPLSALPTAVMLSLCLRLGLAALSLAFFLRKIGCGMLPSLAFSLAYALSSYAIIGSAYPSYLDVLILFPLVVLGILAVARGRGGALLGASLGLSILLCPASAVSLAVFSMLLYGYFRIVLPCPKEKSLLSVAVFAGAISLAFLSGLLALMPFLSLAKLSPSDYPFVQALDFLDFCAKLLPGSFDGVSDASLPYLSVGVLPLLLSIVFFSSRAVPLRLRISTGGLWIFVFFSFSVSAINGLYSLFIPTLPLYGHAYFFVFLLTATGAYAWRYLSASHEKTLILSSGAIVFLAMILQKLAPTYTHTVEDESLEFGYISKLAILWIPMLSSILLTAALTLIARARSHRRALPRGAVALLLLCVCIEGALSSYSLTGMAKNHRNQSFLFDADYTLAFSESILSALELTEQDELYRVISSSALTCDDGLYFGYHSLTALPESILTGLGISLDDRGCLEDADYPLALSILGVRHYIERARIPIGKTKTGDIIYDQPKALSESIKRYFNGNCAVLGDGEDATTVFTSAQALPLLFASHADLSELSLTSADSVPSLLNAYFRGVTGDDTLSLYDEAATSIFGTKAQQAVTGYTVYSNTTSIRIKTVAESDAPLYFSLTTDYPRASTLSVNANGITETYPLYEGSDSERSVTVPLGSFSEGTVLEISIRFPSSSDGLFYLPEDARLLRQENPEAIRKAIELLSSRSASELTFSGNSLSATVVTNGESTVLTSLPAKSGITVKVDGRVVETKYALGEFLAIPISSDGEHRITLTLDEPIGALPTVLSAVGALSLVAFAVLELLVCRNRLSLPYLSCAKKPSDTEVNGR